MVMSNREWEDITSRVYFVTATLDDRFVWDEITPSPEWDDAAEVLAVVTGDKVTGYAWADGAPRYRCMGCAHKHYHNGRCETCGKAE